MTLLDRKRAALQEAAPRAPYRADIDGLRALAIALVVAYHVWFGRVSGGVDVFLMISAYFMTASFARRATHGSTEPVLSYWVRRFARLLPAAVVTMLGILVTVAIAFPSSSWPEVWRQTWASLLYFQNWELIASSADYYDRGSLSPLQHFWSLSIQGQVFIVWPVLMLSAVTVARAISARVVPALAVLFAVVFAGSLAYSLVATSMDQQSAYFNTFARLWEFALGSLLALVVPRVRLPRLAAVVVGWIGIVGLVLCGALLDVQGGFPGYLALWPTLSAAAVIIAGSTATAGGPTRFLASPPLRRVSVISYALYLVHWPVLVTWLVVTDRAAVGIVGGMFIIALSVVVAFIVTYVVERPVQRWTAVGIRRAAGAVTACVLVVVVPLAGWQAYEDYRAGLPVGNHPGARILMPDGENHPVDADEVIPLGSAIESEWVVLDGSCTEERRPTETVLADTCLERKAEWRSTATVFVIGDSHAQQWMGALIPIAAQQDWTVVALLKGGCAFAPDEPVHESIDGCEEWRDAALAYTVEQEPDMVFVMGTKTKPESAEERVLRGVEDYLDPIADRGVDIVVIRDNPRFETDMFHCVEIHGSAGAECRRNARDVLAAGNPAEILERDGVSIVDLTEFLCPNGVCEPVIGGVAVYIDHDHIGRTYSETMAQALEVKIEDTLQRLRR